MAGSARNWVRAAVACLLAVVLASCLPGSSRDARDASSPQPRRQPPPAADVDGVRLEVGGDFQQVVDANAAGTTYVVASGLHRLQQVVPKGGDTFVGEPGAVLSGARVLDEFERAGDAWVVTGQEQEAEPHGEMEPGRERDAFPHDVFLDGERLRHVGSVDEVEPGAWYFDYTYDQIYIGDDPSGRLVETSVAEWAFGGPGVADVTIENLAVRHYANRAQDGAIHGQDTRGWTLRNVEASFNHGTGIRVGPGWQVFACRATDNGQLGMGGSGEYVEDDPILVSGCEIGRNKQLGYNWAWEGGATKFAKTIGMVFEHNWVYDNIGPGPWFDIDNRDAVIRSNLVEGNTQAGIFYEISYGAEIYWNEVRNNGAEAVGDLGAGIYVSNSSGVEVYENLLHGNKHEVLALQADRGDGAFGPWEVTDLRVRDNDVTIEAGAPGLRVPTGQDEYYTARGNLFSGNTYRLRSAGAQDFYWGESLDAEGWQAAGQDVDGRFLDQSGDGSLPAGAVAFESRYYGPA